MPITVKEVRENYLKSRGYYARLWHTIGAYNCRDLAAIMGVSREMPRRFLRGDTPSAEFLICVALNFGVSLSWLVLGEGPDVLDSNRPPPPGGFARRPNDVLLERVAEELGRLHKEVLAATEASRLLVTEPQALEVVIPRKSMRAVKTTADQSTNRHTASASRKR